MPLSTPVRVGRQAIVDRALDLVGYELLFRAGGADAANLRGQAEHDAATSQVLTAVLGDFGDRTLSTGSRFFVNLTRAFVVGELPLAPGLEDVVLELTEEILVDEEVMAGVHRLRDRGFSLAVDDFEGEPHRLPTLPLAHFVKLVLPPADEALVEADGRLVDRFDHVEQLIALVREHNPAALIVVERVESLEDFQRCRALGADLFQGYWVQRPVVHESASMSPARLSALRLLVALGDPDTPTAEIEHLVLADPALSFRVLRLASSSAVATRSPVSSVGQALVLVGRRTLSSWAALTVVGASSGDGRGQGRAALTFVLARAGAVARLAADRSQEAYTAGLLSGAAEAMGLPLDELLATVNVPPALRGALTEFQGPVGSALAAVLSTEASPTAPPPADAPSPVEAGRAYARALSEAAGLSAMLTS
ncbi:EAL and HDOD domain-containing protein [Quadrisphaera sp. KR29]|uniref:EAL and HDOD domain-containing protein n=1 Tax=Quadrisphaera sp. KR29 TaxID=3461391 RepID=UPI0040441C6E